MARGSGKKRGLTPLSYKQSQSTLNGISIDNSTSPGGNPVVVNPPVVPPTTDPPPPVPILPPTNITIGPVESFSVQATGNGVSTTYTSTDYHGMKSNDVVIISGFSTTDFNGLYKINSYTSKTFTVTGTASGTQTGGTAKNVKNNCGSIVIGNDGSTTVDVTVTFDEMLNASDYQVEVVRID